MLYDITVTTLVAQGKKEYVSNIMTFYHVNEEAREFIAGSCKTTLLKLMKLPTYDADDAWHLKYRTVVRDANTKSQISDGGLITFPGMTRSQIAEFQRWAIIQLSDTLAVIEGEHINDVEPVTHRRSKIATLWKMIWSREF